MLVVLFRRGRVRESLCSSLDDLAKRRDSVDIKEDDRDLTSVLTMTDFCEFQAHLVYTECFRRARATS